MNKSLSIGGNVILGGGWDRRTDREPASSARAGCSIPHSADVRWTAHFTHRFIGFFTNKMFGPPHMPRIGSRSCPGHQHRRSRESFPITTHSKDQFQSLHAKLFSYGLQRHSLHGARVLRAVVYGFSVLRAVPGGTIHETDARTFCASSRKGGRSAE